MRESQCVVDEANYGRESHFDAIECEIDMTKERINFVKNTSKGIHNQLLKPD